MFALFLLAKQSRDLCTVEVHKDWGLEEKGAGRMLLLWVSAVIKHLFSQWGHLSPFQMPLTRVTASPLVFGNGDPFSRWPRDGKGCPGFRKLFILSHFHSWCFLLCLPLPPERGTPRGTREGCTGLSLPGAKGPQQPPMSKARGDAQGLSISCLCCLGTNSDRGFSLCLQGCERKKLCGKHFCWILWAKWPENLTSSYWLALSTCFEKGFPKLSCLSIFLFSLFFFPKVALWLPTDYSAWQEGTSVCRESREGLAKQWWTLWLHVPR